MKKGVEFAFQQIIYLIIIIIVIVFLMLIAFKIQSINEAILKLGG